MIRRTPFGIETAIARTKPTNELSEDHEVGGDERRWSNDRCHDSASHPQVEMEWARPGEAYSLHQVRVLCEGIAARPQTARPTEDLEDTCRARGGKEPPEAGVHYLTGMNHYILGG